ncbi:MAG: hypothetical protein D6785_12600 [Planctomycetota bacterium]|nr:MAG: hypothetical protein D6785_12600 [Planctomycetota bacterium]
MNQGILFFQIHLLDFLGVFPNIFSCHLCGVQIPHGNLHQFHLAESGLLCSSCSGKSSPSSSSHAPSLRREDLKILQRIVQMEREKKKTLSLAPKVLTRLVSFLHPILSYQLERPFHSWLYLQEFSLRTSLT